MVVDEIVNATADTFVGDLIVEIGELGLLLNTLGIIIVLWIIFQVIILIVNRKKRKTLYRIEDRLKIVEEKIDYLIKKRK